MNDSLSMDQVFIMKLTEIVLANITDEGFSVEKLAKEAGMSRTNLYRRLKLIKHQDISKFIREVRLQRAMEMLLNKEGTAAEISFRVGFGSPAYFNKCFHDYYGFPPGEVRKKQSVILEGIQANEPKIPFGQDQQLKSKRGWIPGNKQSKYRITLIIFAGVLTVLALIWFSYALLINRPNEKSIIVLPFKNLSVEKGSEFFADGITEEILNHLFHISDLSVRSRTTSDQIRENSLTAKEIARQEHVRYILEGSIRQFNDEVRITVQLIDARHDQHLWSENFDRKLIGIIGLQGEIALQIALKLNIILTDKEINQIKKIPTRNYQAYEDYLRGRFLLNQASNELRADIDMLDIVSSLRFFEKAIAADKNFAEAYAGLANAYFNLTAWLYLPPQEGGFLKAIELSNKALEIDPDCAEAHAVKGAFHIWAERKFEEGRKELNIALQLNPNFPLVHQWYAQLLMITGPIEEARVHLDFAMEREPYFWVLHTLNAWMYYFEMKYDKAIDACHTAQDLKPDFTDTNWLFFLNYVKQGEGVKAAEELQTIIRLDSSASQYAGEVMDAYNISGIESLFAWLIDLNMNNLGITQGFDGQPFQIAWWHAILGNKEESIYWLEKNMEAKNRQYFYFDLLASNPDFDFLRNDPRFLSIIDQIGLTPYHTRKPKIKLVLFRK